MLVRTDIPQPPFAFAARLDAWGYLQYLLDLMIALFGAPAKLARLGGVSLGFRADMNFWLRPAERLARILLIAEAAGIVLRKRRPHAGDRRRFVPFTDISKPNSEDWRVAFAVLRANTQHGSGAKGYSIPCISAARLAARLEALARVVRDPMRYARRLAARLRAGRFGKVVRALLRPGDPQRNPFTRLANGALDLVPPGAAIAFNTG